MEVNKDEFRISANWYNVNKNDFLIPLFFSGIYMFKLGTIKINVIL